MSKKYVQICRDEISRETEKAILVEGTWLPKSQLLVAINNEYYDFESKEIKEYKEKSVYCLLLPLWLHMKNNMSYKKSDTLDKYEEAWNTDMRTSVKYESIKIMSYKEYKEAM